MYNSNCRDIVVYRICGNKDFKRNPQYYFIVVLPSAIHKIGRVLPAFLLLRLSFLSEILPLFADEQDSFGIDGCGFLLKVQFSLLFLHSICLNIKTL
jgi:hypothetical protein